MWYRQHNNIVKEHGRGFSIVEVLVTLLIGSFVVLAVTALLGDIFSFNRTISEGLNAQYEVKKAFKIMTREIRTAAPASTGAYAIETAATSTFTFYSNVDEDTERERIRYFLDGAILKRGVLDPSGNPLAYDSNNEVVSEIVHGVTNGTSSVFSYYDGTYDGTSAALSEPIVVTDVTLAKINVYVTYGSRTPSNPLLFTTQISMRNLKDAL